ncbi:MAG: Na+/H+ antiporter NhaA [Halioglobus sp.]|nr:Na+/H+ antiporter NhaA [Halioglobus sp.]
MSKQLEQKVESILSPIQAFVRDETASSGFLIAATVAALVLANSPWAPQYFEIIHLPISVAFGEQQLEFQLHAVVNDGLMTIFFLVLGLEIKRELLVGELQDARLATTVLAAAAGGMLFPALIYGAINFQSPGLVGWGIPMATDTAFALAVLLLLGDRVPAGLKAFLVAFAIIDDLGAILVIALFYTESLTPLYIEWALVCVSGLVLCNWLGLRHITFYLLLGGALWALLVAGGVHGTVAGVLLAVTVPARAERGRKWFVDHSKHLATRLEAMRRDRRGEDILTDPEQHETVAAVGHVAKSATTPLRRWERSLERPVLVVILPLFALVNAGIPVSASFLANVAASPVTWGVVLGLLVGKVAGISLLSWLSLRLGLGTLPTGVTPRHVVGVAMLGGMGFTMSIFIADLSFTSSALLDGAKIAILVTSALAGVLGYLWLRRLHEA